MALTLKLLLALEAWWQFAIFLFVVIATGITDWSKSPTREYGIWQTCSGGNCGAWTTTDLSSLKDCEGSLTATRGFSVMSIICTSLALLLALALLLKPTLIKKSTVLILLCWVWTTNIWLLCGWIMYLGVQGRSQCAFGDNGTHLGSAWFLQIFAWVMSLFIAGPIAFLIFLKWKKTPRFAGQPPYVPGPTPGPGPIPYGPASGSYPQYKAPYPAPYSGGYGPAPYSGAFGPTPNTSPYVPTPYW
eukprot:EG_transcript_21657